MPSGDNYMDFHLDYPQSQGAMIMTPKTLHNSDISGTRVNVKDVRVVAERWGYEPNLRAEIKQKLAEQLTMRMRTNDLIDFVVTTAENGDTVITASIEAASTGDERRAAASK